MHFSTPAYMARLVSDKYFCALGLCCLANFVMDVKQEQRVCIKFCYKVGKSATETYVLLNQAYGDVVLAQSNCFEWFKRFKNGRTSTEDDERVGRPPTAVTAGNIEGVKCKIMEDRRLTIREISDDMNISFGSVQYILTKELAMTRVAAKFVPRLLTDEQKVNRMSIAQELLDMADEYPEFMGSIITGDESWIYGYDVETKRQSSQWKTSDEPRPKKIMQSRSNVKAMLITFFDINGIVHHEWVPKGQTVNALFYVEVLKRLRESIRKKRKEMWESNFWFLHHDNAPSHTSLLVAQYLTKHNVTTIPHPPYSPDLAPCDFFLFPKLKSTMKGRRFQTIDDIQVNTENELKTIPKQAYQECPEKWKRRWKRCILSQGEYFEGDFTNLE
jgi:histone-lysine N-methyltransferase SETMAR